MSDKEDDKPVAPDAPPLFTHIIFQAIGFTTFFVLLIPVLIIGTVLHVFPKTRPHPSWSLRRSIAVMLGRLYLSCTTYLSLPRDRGSNSWKVDNLVHKLTGKGTIVKMIVVPPLSEEWIVSIATAGKGYVYPEPVPCFWTFVPSDAWHEGDEVAEPGEKVIMYVNGGSWVMGHPQSTMFPYKFARVSNRRVLAVNHRKAVTSSNAFPAQLLDLTAGYAYLLSRGFAPENIILIGDSSGGHLMLALSRYISELSRIDPNVKVGMPGAMLLISPSCDLSHAPHPRSRTDFLVPYLNERAYPSLIRHFASSAVRSSPYFSPAICGSFAYLAVAQKDRSLPVWIQYGSVENLHDDIESMITRMESDGVSVDIDRLEGGVHLDAGISFALGEKGPGSSWEKLLEAVRRYTQ